MAGINQGVPEVGVGEPMTLGDNGEYELEHDPVTDRLIVRDTVNSTEAYVRPETNDQIGNQGAFIRALVNGEPLADDGRLYSSVQAAEEAANGWVFVPPGTFNENVQINTSNFTLAGAGEGTVIDGGTSDNAIHVDTDNVTVRDLAVQTTGGGGNEYSALRGDGSHISLINVVCLDSDDWGLRLATGSDYLFQDCRVEASDDIAILAGGLAAVVTGCRIESGASEGVYMTQHDSIVTNNVITGVSGDGIRIQNNDDAIIAGNVIRDAGRAMKIGGTSTDVIVANNRTVNSNGIDDFGTGTLLDGNLTG